MGGCYCIPSPKGEGFTDPKKGTLKPTFEGTNGAERAGLHSWSADDESYRHQTHGEITGPVGQQDYFASTTGQSRSPINHLISRQ